MFRKFLKYLGNHDNSIIHYNSATFSARAKLREPLGHFTLFLIDGCTFSCDISKDCCVIFNMPIYDHAGIS